MTVSRNSIRSRAFSFGLLGGNDAVPCRRADHPIENVKEDGPKNDQQDNFHDFPQKDLAPRMDPATLLQMPAAAEKGCRIKYPLATRPVNELVEAAGEKILAKTTACCGRVGLLCIDDFGRMDFCLMPHSKSSPDEDTTRPQLRSPYRLTV